MRRVAVEDLPTDLAGLIVSAQAERVVITRVGEPYALVVGLDNKDAEDLELEFSPDFWRMIEERRRETASVPLEQVLADIAGDEQRLREGNVDVPGKAPVVGS
jgi:antitoxin (DNA-binding transcriptional repressor) of toxin-antitoxin stability system